MTQVGRMKYLITEKRRNQYEKIRNHCSRQQNLQLLNVVKIVVWEDDYLSQTRAAAASHIS
ncbi:MAG: hypothetical protein WBZ36_21635 [Candidatus Nitrosopolaris sp.]